ncbi:hypothetical protein E4665_10075 [Sporolactobacillus shoreae]|uniref:Uncharacterized protein n=1 Tax=Sporolactobacillus shoreae TaxID=1465501 RepID=A0A4Z0GLX0_9BACL|nr:hypothetical protein [Sporolactobacillus shoreae]TGA98001.1 hypothetical protein E4665_10075 [Sporolactobacillus shoreae]
MTAWRALFKKEIRLGSLGFFVFLGFELVLMAFGVWLYFRALQDGGVGYRSVMFIIGVVLMTLHFFYLFGYLIVNAIQERKTFHLWLNNPLPAWSMLGAKMVVGLIYMTLSFLVASIYTWIGSLLIPYVSLPAGVHVYRTATVLIAYLYWVALYIGIVFMFLWTIERIIRSRIGRLVWIILPVGVILMILLLVKLSQWGILAFFYNWGELPSSVANFLLPYSFFHGHIYIGNFVMDLLVMALLFAGSSWLMDHKLEVS